MPGHAKAPATVSDINVTPLVDVMLVLLINHTGGYRGCDN